MYHVHSNKYVFIVFLIYRICKDIICGLDYCHRNRIVHMDIKPQNVLVCLSDGSGKKFICKICDFGSSINISASSKKLLNPNSNVRNLVL